MILTEICVGVVEICEDAPDCTKLRTSFLIARWS